MRLKLLTLLFILWIPTLLEAQYVTVTGTAVDSDSQAWIKGTYKLEFYPNPSFPNFNQYYINGVPLSNFYHGSLNGVLDNSGAFSQGSVPNNAVITPTGSQYTVTICPNASAPCGTFVMPITGNVDISSTIASKIPAPRFQATSGSYGYNDTEVSTSPKPGSTYWNTITPCQRYYDGSVWACGTGGGGGGSIAGPNFISLAAQAGATTQAKFDSAITAYSGSPTTIYVDPTVPSGYPSSTHPLNTNVRVFDFRGTNCMDSGGGFLASNANDNAGPCFYAREDASDPRFWMIRSALTVGYDSEKGGFYNWIPGSGTKSNRFGMQVNMLARTVAQNWAHKINFTSLAGGEAIPLGIDTYAYGGYVSNGQEQNEGIRIQQNQAGETDSLGGTWTGTVASKTSSTVVWSGGIGNSIGESRFIRDIGSKITGTFSNVSCSGSNPTTCTITGTGFSALSGYATNPHTTWNNLSVGGNILTNNAVFCIPLQFGSSYDACVPITNIINDTTLTVNLYAPGPQQNTIWSSNWATSGTYALYKSIYPTSIDIPTSTITAADTSGITVGHVIDQVVAYNGQFTGVFVLQGSGMGLGNTAFSAQNFNFNPSSNQPGSGGGAFVATGVYNCGLCLQSINSVKQNYAVWVGDQQALPTNGFIGMTGGTAWPAGDYPVLFDKIFFSNNEQYLKLGRWQAIQIYDQDATNAMGFNAAPNQNGNIQFDFLMNHNIGRSGMYFEGPYPDTSMYPFSVNFDGPLGGVVVPKFPAFYLKGTGVNTNVYAVEVGIANGTPLNGYSDNQVTKTWSISPVGIANFKGLTSGTTSNTDLQGQLTLSSTTTASFSFIGSYANAPLCRWELRFNSGTATHWDTTSTTQAQITFSSAVSGTVNYFCVSQN